MFFSIVGRLFSSLIAVAVSILFCGASLAAWTGDVPKGHGTEPRETLGLPLDDWLETPPAAGAPRLQLAFEDSITGAVVKQLQRGAAECNRLEPVYRIDCLRRVYAQAAGATGNRRDYAGANSALRSLARQLNGIVRQNLDRKAEKAKIGRNSYRAVTREALRKANSLAAQAIQETRTKLLRSAGNSRKRKVHYTSIANAVNSTKKILRS